MKSNNQKLREIIDRLHQMSYVDPSKIPDIPLYMDQLTTFMDEHLKEAKRNPEDVILTKTMINNYAKNNLLPPPIKKKYSKEHILLLIFIYYFKNMLTFKDIETLFAPVTSEHFADLSELSLQDIYQEIVAMEKDQMYCLTKDVVKKFHQSKKMFTEAEGEDKETLQLFAFICLLSFDVYLKKQMMETLIDSIQKDKPEETKKKKK